MTGPTKLQMDEVKQTLPDTHGRVIVLPTKRGKIYRARVMTSDVPGVIARGVWRLSPEQPYRSQAWCSLERAKRRRPDGYYIRQYQRALQEGRTICLGNGTGDPWHNLLLRLKCDLLHIVTPLSMGTLSLRHREQGRIEGAENAADNGVRGDEGTAARGKETEEEEQEETATARAATAAETTAAGGER